MSAYGDSRWHDDCCGDCSSCLHFDNNNDRGHPLSKRFVTVGSVRYGVRLGAVSPPPPGAGPRYRSQCCWPSSTTVSGPICGPGPVSRIPLLTTSPINSRDIFSCVNRVRMAEDATSELPEQAQTVRDQLLNSTKSLLKTQLRRRAFRSQVYDRLCECGDGEGADFANTLDRLPRFRFGGNRGTSSKVRERDKRDNELRLRELTDRLKRGPIPPPRTRHMPPRTPQTSQSSQTPQSPQPPEAVQEKPPTPPDEASNLRTVPLRSASFSQVDYSTNDKKYVRRRLQGADTNILSGDSISGAALTLPRTKPSAVRSLSYNDKPDLPTTILEPETSTATDISETNKTEEDDYKTAEPAENPTDVLSECIVRNSSINADKDTSNAQEKKRDKSRRRKGIYISQWPNAYQSSELIPQFAESEDFTSPTEELPKTITKEIPKLQISSDKSENVDMWSTPQEPLSPEEDSQGLDWPRPPLSTQNSEDKDTQRLSSRTTLLLRADSLSEGEPDHDRRSEVALIPSDVSDCESRTSIGNDTLSPHIPRRYSKRPLRGPYGQMLEAEMKKPETGRKNQYNDLKFLEDLSTGSGTCSMVSLSSSSSVGAGDPKPKYVTRTRGASNYSLDDSQLNKNNLLTPTKPVNKRKVSADSVASQELDNNNKVVVSHQRTTSSPSKLEGLASSPSKLERLTPTEASNELLEQLLRGSSEKLAAEANLQRLNDTRTHVVVELFDTERSYVESLQILVTKYLEPLKSPENAGLLDAGLVDEIFFQIPTLLSHHQLFLEELRKRLEQWDVRQKIGDVLFEMFSNPGLSESYTSYVNNWKRAREIYKNAQQSKPAFARFLGAMAREHKGKLALDALLIKPIQKFPKYELLLQRLIKHTDTTHPDHNLLLSAQREIHEQLLKINCTEREALELDQLRELEGLIEGLMELVSADRQFLRHDLVSMAAGASARKERALFLFSDLLLVTSIKRRSGTIRRPVTVPGSGVTTSLDANKYKLLMKIALDDLDIVRAKDENIRQMMQEIEHMTEDLGILNQITELTWSLHCNHTQFDEILKEMTTTTTRILHEQQNSDSQLSCLDLQLNTATGMESVSVVFQKPDKRSSWEEAFNEAKHKLAISGDRMPCPELLATVPIRKTRAGLQFTCAAPTLCDNGRDVWVCNSDGYVGQVCVLSLYPEATVTSCNGVCNARILCIASVPGVGNSASGPVRPPKLDLPDEHTSIQFDSCSSSGDDEASDIDEHDLNKRASTSIARSTETVSIDSDDADGHQSTMWLGTEDGCIHVYNSSDNIRIKKNKIRLQHGASILCIIYLGNRVFVSLANGDIAIYDSDNNYGWNTGNPTIIQIGSATMPVSKMLPNGGNLWCACGNFIKILNTETLQAENCFAINNDSNKIITCMVLYGNGVWVSMQNSAIIRCFHATAFEYLCEVNVAASVTKMLTSCDDIIRQHKAACLRVTSLLACKEMLFIGTSAGVLLTMPLPHITPTTVKLTGAPTVMGIPHGHTGHVRFLTFVEWNQQAQEAESQPRPSFKGKAEQRTPLKLLVISGGDGYEDFRSSNLSEVAGREDSTNHLLLWTI